MLVNNDIDNKDIRISFHATKEAKLGQMADFIRDSSWQFFGVLATIILGVLSFYFDKRARQIKRLQIALDSMTSITSVKSQYDVPIKVFFGDAPIEDLWLAKFVIGNIGNQPIQMEDFDRNRTTGIAFDEYSNILQVIPDSMQPEYLEVTTTIENGKVVIAPMLLNRNESFDLAIFVSSEHEPMFRVEHGISGCDLQDDEGLDKQARQWASHAVRVTVFIAALFALGLIVALLSSPSRYLTVQIDLASLLIAVVFIAVAITFLARLIRWLAWRSVAN